MVFNGFFPIIISVLVLIIAEVHSLRCIECSQIFFHGEPGLDDCYKLEGARIVNKTNCRISEPGAYCFTKLEISDGIISYLERGCSTPQTDHLITDEYPDSVTCTTSYQRSKEATLIQQTECYMPCKGEKCNNDRILDGLESCPEMCPTNSECNYLTGKCQCAPNRFGENCTAVDPMVYKSRTCVQCNSKTEPGCGNKTEGTVCQNGQRHCSTAQTWILKRDGSSDVEPVVTRSCTSQYLSPDRCYLTKTSDLEPLFYTEYTCVSTCSADNCNTGMANGILDEEFIPLRCVVCEGDETRCGPDRKLTIDCPYGTTHCSSTVTYWEAVIADWRSEGIFSQKPEPSVSIRSIKRECASQPAIAECNKTQLGFQNLKEVTCRETCVGNGCNTGWPARPKCVTCTDAGSDSNQACLAVRAPVKHCPTPHHEYCYTKLSIDTVFNAAAASKRGQFTLTRGCSTSMINTTEDCIKKIEYGRDVGISCWQYCSKDGCNTERFDHVTGGERIDISPQSFPVDDENSDRNEAKAFDSHRSLIALFLIGKTLFVL